MIDFRLTKIAIEAETTVASELDTFYLKNDLPPDGGVQAPNVKITFNRWCFIYIPNFSGRKKALLRHDIHHLVTGYSAGSIAGESEVSAWEIASGCKAYWGAFLINTSGAMMGVVLNVKRVFRAFVQGRHSRNLYHNTITTEDAMKMRLSELKLILRPNSDESTPTVADWLFFVGFCIFGLVYSILLMSAVPFIIGYTLYTKASKRHTITLLKGTGACNATDIGNRYK